MAMNIPPISIGVTIGPDETALNRALIVVEWYLADHPEKTIVVEQEGDLRVCLIANVDGSPVEEGNNAEEKQSL